VFELIQVVTSLDVKLVVSLWKAISRLAGKHRQVVTAGGFSRLQTK